MTRPALLVALALCAVAVAGGASSAAYDPVVSRHALNLAGATYCPASQLSAWSCSFCGEESSFVVQGVARNGTTNMQAVVGYSGVLSSVVVAFKGTSPDSITNWLADLTYEFLDEECPECAVHEGFYDTYLSVRDQVVPLLQAAMAANPDAPLLITGHSLGGALTNIAAVDFLTTLGVQAAQVWTFGQPRVGNAEFAAFYREKLADAVSWRVTHNRDPVPHVPTLTMGYQHHATEVFYNLLNTGYKVCDASGEDPSCANQFVLFDPLDHGGYLSADFMLRFTQCQLSDAEESNSDAMLRQLQTAERMLASESLPSSQPSSATPTWQTASFRSQLLPAVCMGSSLVGWMASGVSCASSGNQILRTEDGGATWTHVAQAPPQVTLLSCAAWNDTLVVFAGSSAVSGSALVSVDGLLFLPAVEPGVLSEDVRSVLAVGDARGLLWMLTGSMTTAANGTMAGSSYSVDGAASDAGFDAFAPLLPPDLANFTLVGAQAPVAQRLYFAASVWPQSDQEQAAQQQIDSDERSTALVLRLSPALSAVVGSRTGERGKLLRGAALSSSSASASAGTWNASLLLSVQGLRWPFEAWRNDSVALTDVCCAAAPSAECWAVTCGPDGGSVLWTGPGGDLDGWSEVHAASACFTTCAAFGPGDVLVGGAMLPSGTADAQPDGIVLRSKPAEQGLAFDEQRLPGLQVHRVHVRPGLQDRAWATAVTSVGDMQLLLYR